MISPISPATPGKYSHLLILLLLMAIGSARVITTYHVFSQTVDEPAHIACGLEWLARGTYTSEVQHPPLARVAAAAGVYLRGAPYDDRVSDKYERGNQILAFKGEYRENLTISRLGILPFFWAASLGVFFWCRRLASPATALLAVLLFTNLPPVLAHAGLATTDMAITATFTWALYTFVVWLESPRKWASIALGFAVALMLLSKLSCLLFFPVAVFAIAVAARIGNPKPDTPLRRSIRPLVIAFVVFAITVWAGYRFSVTVLGETETMQKMLLRAPSSAWLRVVANTPIPAAYLIRGIGAVALHLQKGHITYLFGESRTTGWWYYFPVALAVKTPLGFLVLVFAGFGFAWAAFRRLRDWRPLVPSLVALAVLVACLPSTINIGVRHILPIYPLLAIVAAMAAARMFARRRTALLAVLLIAWMLVSSAAAHPDYLAYFNELGARHPERISLDSDLDWGQDLDRLAAESRARGLDGLAICYFGSADLARPGLPTFKPFKPGEQPGGCLAVSLTMLQHFPQEFAFLTGRPYRLIGRSIRLYCP